MGDHPRELGRDSYCHDPSAALRSGRDDRGKSAQWVARQTRIMLAPGKPRIFLRPPARLFLVWSLCSVGVVESPRGGRKMAGEKKTFVARALFHHITQTSKFATLLVYRDAAGTYELFHDSDEFHGALAGTEDFILSEWRKANQHLIESDYQRDCLSVMGGNKFQQVSS